MWRKNIRACNAFLLPALRLAPVVVVFIWCPQLLLFSAWDLLALEHVEVAVIYDNIIFIVIRLLKEILHRTNKFVGLININLAPGSQKKMNQLLLNCCISAFIVTKETQLKFLTTFLKKDNLLITCRSFLTTQGLYSHGQKSIFVCEATCSAVLHQKSFVIASSFVMSESVMQDTVVRVWCKILFHVINSQPFNSEFFFCFFVIIFLPQNG